jgi:hypothetical protein
MLEKIRRTNKERELRRSGRALRRPKREERERERERRGKVEYKNWVSGMAKAEFFYA